MPEANDRSEQDGGQPSRPGRRSVQDRHNTVFEVLQGKSTVDDVVRHLGGRQGQSTREGGWTDRSERTGSPYTRFAARLVS
jgi:hypothetical protein